ESPRIAHHTVVFPARSWSRASPPLGGAPTDAYNGMVAIYAIPRRRAERPPTRYSHFPSVATAFSIIFCALIVSAPAVALAARAEPVLTTCSPYKESKRRTICTSRHESVAGVLLSAVRRRFTAPSLPRHEPGPSGASGASG